MAAIVVFRVALALSGPVVRWCVTNGCDANTAANALARFAGRLSDPGEDPDELSSDITAYVAPSTEGGSFIVTDFTGTFELRKAQVRMSRAPSGGTVEDVAVNTYHFIKTSAGSPAAWVDGTDLPALETLLNSFWGSIKGKYRSFVHLDQYRWYADGPAFYELNEGGTAYVPIGDNPALRVTEVDVAGTQAGANALPPQCAMTVTEKCSSRKNWGRWYLPAPTAVEVSTEGRIDSTALSDILTAAVTLYNGARAANYVPVVWSIQKPERPKKPSGTLPAQVATAFEVTSLQMDNLFDVIRSRRWGAATVKTNTALT